MDLISRQDAINVIRQYCIDTQIEDSDYHSFGIEYELNNLPSAEPQIIRCKDCRWGREACGNIECFADTNVPPEYHSYEWFCPNGERI